VTAAKVDGRTAVHIERQTEELLWWYLRRSAGENEGDVGPSGALAGLIAIFGRFAEIIIGRLNQAPDHNLLAFLDRLGISRLPAQAARVPVTFQLTPGRLQPTIVAAGTQVAAAPEKGDSRPVVFATQRELVVVPARLAGAHMVDGANDACHAWTTSSGDVLENRTSGQTEHTVYLGLDDFLELAHITEIRISVELSGQVTGERQVNWEISAEPEWVPLKPDLDTTCALSKSGEIVFKAPPVAAESKVRDVQGRWLRCRLATRLVPGCQLPDVRSVSVQVAAESVGLLIDRALSETSRLDITRDFFPFGPRPHFGSVFYFVNVEAFSLPNVQLDIDVQLTNPTTGGPEPPIPRTNAAGGVRLAWEFWDGRQWIVCGVSGPDGDKTKEYPAFEDSTRAFTQSGHIKFQLPASIRTAPVNGIDAPWIRTRLAAGNYGSAETPYIAVAPAAPAPLELPPRTTLAPPSIQCITIAYTITKSAMPARTLTFNNFMWSSHKAGETFQPFQAAADARPALYIGFEPLVWDSAAPFGDRSLSLYFVVAGYAATVGTSDAPAGWEYWNGARWLKWTVSDETASLSRSAPVRILPPEDFAPRPDFEPRAYWMRSFVPLNSAARLERILLNTVLAFQAVTHKAEVLGASDGSANQVFRTLHAPILDAPSVEVREPQEPPPAEREQLEQEEGEDILLRATDSAGRPNGAWVRWHEAPDFHGSNARHRHYVVNHFTGEVSFGDARRGMIPPAGLSNIRASYRTGGTSAGNRERGSITQMKTTVPYIGKVVNYEPSVGGVDAEDEGDLCIRGAATLRHGGRAVACEDYEDLAVLASPEVARAKCVPLRDLADPQDPNGAIEQPGFVSVIVVPNCSDPKPLPTRELLDRVYHYLEERNPPAVRLSVVPPEYVRIDVDVEVVQDSSDTGDVELAIVMALNAYLHPLTGGLDGTGQKFGRRVRMSDLHRILKPVPGVLYVSRLDLHEHEDRPSVGATNRFLTYSGVHKVMVLAPED
jgi:hypothetical protein